MPPEGSIAVRKNETSAFRNAAPLPSFDEEQARTQPITRRPYRSDRRVLRARETLYRRSRAFDSATDELDEWMVACPQADVLPSSH